MADEVEAGAPPPGPQPDSSATLPGQHPDVAPDFAFGQLAASEATVSRLIGRHSGVYHNGRIAPHRPTADAAVLVTTTTGPAYPTGQVWLYYTTDGSRPAGHGGRARNGAPLALAWQATEWMDLIWDYLSVWQAEIPPQPAGTYVRYQIEALPVPGSAFAPAYADADPKAAGGLEPVFSYLVDAPAAPAWIHEAVMYHVYLDRFYPGDGKAWLTPQKRTGLMGGTLRGVIDKLDYIAGLGFNALWLSPLFASPSFHRYDATDLFRVDPALGTNEDLGDLVQAAHARGIRVLLDLVPNHISNKHPYFVEAQADPDSPYRDWFTFTNWPDDYAMFFTSRGMPRLNHENPATRAYFFDAVRFWLEQYGIDGYRLDYVLGPSHDFWTDYYRTVKAVNPASYSVGEATGGAEMMRSYEGRMDGSLDFIFLTHIRSLLAFQTITLSGFDRFLEQTARYFAPGFVNPTFLDNHDMNRFLWVAKGDLRKLRLAAAIQFTLPPPPIVYYGTEAGIRQTGDARRAGDVEARGPMPWEDLDADLLAYYRRLIALRRAHPAVWQGTRTRLYLDEATGLYAYASIAPGQPGLATLLNLGSAAQSLQVTLPPGTTVSGAPRDLLNDHPVTADNGGLRVTLPPLSAAIVALEPGS